MRAATRFAAMRASNVVGCAGDAAPSRAGPRLNSAATTRRPAGQRRITARVMRSFTPSHGPRRRGPRLGVHTLPFQAHPRVASRPKSPAPIVATLFGLPATLRAGTESVLFPWRCSRRGRKLWVVRTAPQNATRPARAASRWSALEGKPPASRPASLCRPLQASGVRSVLRPARPSSASSGRHSPLPP